MSSKPQYFVLPLILMMTISLEAYYLENICYTKDLTGFCVPLSNCTVAVNLFEKYQDVSKIPPEQYEIINREICVPKKRISSEVHMCCKVSDIIKTTTFKDDFFLNIIGFGLLNSELPRCGKQFATNDMVILARGRNATEGEFPWMAQLIDEREVVLCGGSLITKRHILTSAHCIKRDEVVSVVLGELHVGPYSAYVDRYGIEKKVFHPEYNANHKYITDIGIIKLDRDVTNENVNTICMPIIHKFQGSNVPGYIIAGWGSTESGKAPKTLQAGLLLKRNRSDCSAKYHDKYSEKLQICGGGIDYSESCSGDSGGPVMFYEKFSDDGPQIFSQRGIVTRGAYVCGSGLPSYFVEVEKFVAWLTRAIY